MITDFHRLIKKIRANLWLVFWFLAFLVPDLELLISLLFDGKIFA
jgi:hypothetical protein